MLRFTFALLALVAGVAVAEEKKDAPKLSGSWVREAEGLEIKFTFEAKTVAISVMSGGNGMTATADYTIDKDGVVKAKITKVEEKGEFPAKPEKGLEMTMKVVVKDKKATISDFKSPHEGAKAVIEGEYEKKPD